MSPLLGYSYARLQRRLDVLEFCRELSKLAGAMRLTREASTDSHMQSLLKFCRALALLCIGCVACPPLTALVFAT